MARKPSKLAQQYRNVFSTTEGQAVLADIMGFCGMYSDTAESNELGDLAMARGRRNVGLMIATKLNYHEREFPQLAHNHNEALLHE